MRSSNRYINNFTRSASRLPGIVLLLASIAIGLFCYSDYGVAWDEPEQREMGEVSYNYITHHDPTLSTSPDRDHGVGFELLLTVIEKKLHLSDSRDIYLARHLITHLFFLLGAFVFYLLALRLFKNQLVACLGYLLIAFHPRLYAHSFFNTKDIPFLVAGIFCLWLFHISITQRKLPWLLLLGIASGYATSIRITGVLFIALISLFLFIDVILSVRQKAGITKSISFLGLFIICSLFSLFVFWPVLWEHPLQSFMGNFRSLSHFPWNGLVLFNGQLVPARTLPWYYLPGWFAITVPLLWLLTGLAGILIVAFQSLRAPRQSLALAANKTLLLSLLCFIAPLAAIIVMHSVVYDDWRHAYFIYPPFVLLALFALHKAATGKMRYIVAGMCILQLIATGAFMISAHPFQQLYFNPLIPEKSDHIRQTFEQDYWGCSYKQGLEYILAHDTSSVIKIDWRNRPVKTNIRLIPVADRKRIQFVEDSADYFITTFRGHPADYNYPAVFYQLRLQNSCFMRVYKTH